MRTKVSKKTRAIALAICLIGIIAGSLSFSASANPKEVDTEAFSGECQVTDADIVNYLEGNGYSNVTVSWLEYPNCKRLAHSSYSYDTWVFCTETAIIGHEDIPN